ncbi:unnamed protein product [Microthlaspi erraticum]|uniref:DUF223 domain-containing protein n=1 Tax=Microthlaspi erraticum TaxID=1685480 RepID=A0A6D2J3H5_9BRAS|nr:unnamed protein product [Microthlaspi erraticum]
MDGYHRDVSALFPWVGPTIIRIKVFRRAEVTDEHGNPGLDFIFVDEHREVSRFKITSDNWIKNENLINKHDYVIILSNESVVKTLDPLSNNHFFEFKDFADVINGKHNVLHSLDLIGVISYIGKLSPPSISSYRRRSIPFQIKNERNIELYCIAYGELAEDLYESWKKMNRTNIVAVIREWKITKSDGEIIVIDAGGLSSFWFDPSIAEAETIIKNINKKDDDTYPSSLFMKNISEKMAAVHID